MKSKQLAQKVRNAWAKTEIGEPAFYQFALSEDPINTENADHLIFLEPTKQNRTPLAELREANNWADYPQLHKLSYAKEWWVLPDDPIVPDEVYYLVVKFGGNVKVLFRVSYTIPDISYTVVAIL